MAGRCLRAEERKAEKNLRFLTKESSNKPSWAPEAARSIPGGFSFPRIERLRSRRLIQQLFKEGRRITESRIQAVYLFLPATRGSHPAAVAFSVPKRSFPRAVDRNRIKRLMREAWRTQKRSLMEILFVQQKQLLVMFVCRGTKLPQYAVVNEEINRILNRLIDICETDG